MARTRSIQEECAERYEKFREYMTKVRQYIISQNYKEALGGDLRGAIENISPIVLFDIAPTDALAVLEGRKEWAKDVNGHYTWLSINNPVAISGTSKIKRTIPILYNKIYQEILPLRASYLSITSDVESITKTYDNLSVYYSDTSYTPHGNVNALNLENTALSAYRQIVELFDRLHGYSFISPETESLYASFLDENDLKLPNVRIQSTIAELDTCSVEEKNKMTDIFSDIKDNVLKGVLVLPSTYTGSITAKDFSSLFSIPWSLIIDYNKNTADGIYATFSDEEKVFYPEVVLQSSDSDLYIADGIHRHSWVFAEGNNNNYSTIIVNRTNRELRKRNSAIVNCIKKTEKNNACDFAFILIHPEFERFSKVIDMLYYDAAYVNNFELKFHFYIIPLNSNQKEDWELSQKTKEYGENLHILNIKDSELISCAAEIMPLSNFTDKKFSIFSNNKYYEIPESEMCKYHESGIEFVDISSDRGNDDWDFYDGAEITWKEIQEGKAIKRKGHDIYLEDLKNKIRNNRSIQKNQFLYYPGSGATTFLRQIAYDIDAYSKNSTNFQCLPVFIKRHEPALLLDSLTKLTSIYDGALLVIFESYVLSEESYENLCDDLKKQEKHRIYFIRITPTTNQSAQSILANKLKPEERTKFNSLFNKQGLLSSAQIEQLNNIGQITAIDYPLLAKDSTNADSYAMVHFANTMLNLLPDEWKDACILISFVYKYTGKSVSLSLLKNILNGKDSLSKWTSETQRIIKRLLVEVDENGHPTNSWRPRYRVLGDCILASHFSTERENWITPSNLYKLSKQLIKACSSFICEINTEDEQILQRLFTEKSEEDFRRFDNSEDYLSSFPLVIQDIRDYDLITDLMSEIVAIYPDNPYFLAHYSRFLYEYTSHQKYVKESDASFQKAQDLIDKATRCNEKSDKVYHMQGTLYNRIIRVFRNREKDSAELSLQSALNVKSWMDKAIKAFFSSEFYSPLNPYGYMTEGQTIQQGIEAIAVCLGDSNYDFCEKEPWTEYINRLNTIILQLSELIKSSDSNNGNEEMFGRLCTFHIKLIGSDKETCETYYKKALSRNKTKSDRIRFSQLYYWSTLYQTQQNNSIYANDSVNTLSHIKGEEYERMERILLHAIQDDCIPAFKQLHELRLYSEKDYSIEEAIRHWKLCVEKCETLNHADLAFTLMNAYYMLESYYAARFVVSAINEDEFNENDRRQYFIYRDKAISSAHKYNKRGTITSYYFLGNADDARILISARDNNEMRRKVKCQIIDVKQRSGRASVLPCGLEASFGASKKTLQNVGETDYWQLGFRYEGVGLYDERDRYKEEFIAETFSSEKENVEREKIEIETQDVTPPDNSIKERKIEKITLSESDTNRFAILDQKKKVHSVDKTIVANHGTYEEGEIVHGTICSGLKSVIGPKGRCTVDNKNGFSISPKDCDYETIKHVVFKVRVGKNFNNPSLPWYYATNIQPDE